MTMLPDDERDVVSQAVRLVKGQDTKLPKPAYRVISLPFAGWNSIGPLMGRAAALLDAPDNNVVMVECIEANDAELVLPEVTSSFSVANSPSPVQIDDDIVDIMTSVLTDTKVKVRRVPVDDMMGSQWWYAMTPLIVEAYRIRRRGVPLCTPMVFRCSSDDASSASIVASAIYPIVEIMRVGVLSASTGDGLLFDELSLIAQNYSSNTNDASCISHFSPERLDDNAVLSFRHSVVGKGIEIRPQR